MTSDTNKEMNGGDDAITSHNDHPATAHATDHKAYKYGGNPLARIPTGERLPAFGGEFQPGLYTPTRKFGNPAPLGLSAFAFTAFLLSLINVQANDVTEPNIVVSAAFGYGGLIQLCSGMWELAVNNTFGATTLSSYGGFWISYAILLTPGGFQIKNAYSSPVDFQHALGFFMAGWFIFTTMLLSCTLRSTVAFFAIFLLLDLTFLMLTISQFRLTPEGKPDPNLVKAGGVFGLLTAFVTWYNALAGLADSSNSFYVIPVAHFPWSEKGRAAREKTDRETV